MSGGVICLGFGWTWNGLCANDPQVVHVLTGQQAIAAGKMRVKVALS